MPKFLEDRLKAEAASKGFSEKQTARYVYGALNNLGAMRGNQPTAKGARMEAKHEADMTKPRGRTKSSVGHPARNLGKYHYPRKVR